VSTGVDLSRQEAYDRWYAALQETGWLTSCPMQEIQIAAALGRIITHPVMARRSVPHYAGSAMDGFAVRAADTSQAALQHPILLTVVPVGAECREGQAVPVDTGDVLPAGADSVIMREHATLKADRLEIGAPARAGQHVRQIGEDIETGTILLPAGTLVGPAEIAAAMAAGADRVNVMARPRITVIPTGDEIVDSADELPAGRIRDINSYMLAALFEGWGCEARRHSVIPDDKFQLSQAVATAVAASDLVVMNAGTSGGAGDFTRSVLDSLGQVVCHGVAIRPGRPVLLALVDGKPVIGLPGYPVSCLLTATLFLKELLHEYQRRPLPPRQVVRARLATVVHSRTGAENYYRVLLEEGAPLPVARVLPKGASLISTLTQAHGLLRIAADCSELDADTVVEVELF
jgi:putative molybdopterin biosynthesis protein